MSACRVDSTLSGSSSMTTPVSKPSPATSPRSRPTLAGLRASAPTMSTPFSSISRVATEFIAPTPYTIALIRLIAVLSFLDASSPRRNNTPGAVARPGRGGGISSGSGEWEVLTRMDADDAGGLSFEPLTPTAFLARSELVHAARPALLDGGFALTYAELGARARRLAGGLRALGAGDGERVAVLAANSHL